MTAREKFIARLKELGLYDEWRTGDKAGKIMDDGSIVVLVHYEWDPSDSYDEFHFPPFDEMWKNESFRKECASSYLEHTDDKFVADLARWLEYGPGCHYDCPLWPVDAYPQGGGLETEVITFKDDPEVVMYGRKWAECESFTPVDGKDWIVAVLGEGTIWMNNEDGKIVLVKPDGKYLVSEIQSGTEFE